MIYDLCINIHFWYFSLEKQSSGLSATVAPSPSKDSSKVALTATRNILENKSFSLFR